MNSSSVDNIAIRFVLKNRSRKTFDELKQLENKLYWQMGTFVNQIRHVLLQKNSLGDHPYCLWTNMEETWTNGQPYGLTCKLSFKGTGISEATGREQETFLMDACWFASQAISFLRKNLQDVRFRVELGISYTGSWPGGVPYRWVTLFDSAIGIVY